MAENLMHLSNKTLRYATDCVIKPGYDPADIVTGIVHLGIGAFHRAHQAVYTDDVLASGDHSWGITGVSLRSGDTRDALAPQDGLYTLGVRDGYGEQFRIIGSIKTVLVAAQDPEAVLNIMSDADVRIVSMSVTEKGYCYLPATATLDESHVDIIHDLRNRQTPRSAVGFIVEALRRRRASGIAPFTLLSCDNLPANGETLKRVVTRFAELCDAELGAYIAQHVAFPSTMVDRIVPATTDADRLLVSQATGLVDNWPIITEPFSQWVVEDRFPTGRPEWDKFGVTFVEDVSAFELMKLRLLNGSHSALAYLGYLAGHETVSQTMQGKGFAEFVRALMDVDVTPTLPQLPDFDLAAYKHELRERFRNPALHHRTWQIAMDGSQKLPQRLLNTIRLRLAQSQSFDYLALGVAGWMLYARGIDETGQAIDVRDPLRDEIQARIKDKESPPDLLDAYLSIDQIFGTDLPANPEFRSTMLQSLSALMQEGSAKCVASFAKALAK